MNALKTAVCLIAALSLLEGCADESQKEGVDSDRGHETSPPFAGPSTAGGLAAHSWCKQNQFKGSKIDGPIVDVWVGGRDNVWIFVNNRRGGVSKALLHWNGRDLCTVDLGAIFPRLGTVEGSTWGAVAGAPEDLWAAVAGNEQAVLHWDGTAWSRVPGVDGYVSDFFYFGPSDVYALGKKIHRWDGASWSEAGSQFLPKDEQFTGWADSQHRIWVVWPYAEGSNGCDVALISTGPGGADVSCFRPRAEGPRASWVTGIDDRPWFKIATRPSPSRESQVVLLQSDDTATEMLDHGKSAACVDLTAAGGNMACRLANDDYIVWSSTQTEASALKVPKGFRIRRPSFAPGLEQDRNQIWAYSSSKIIVSPDGISWNVVVSLSKEATRP